MYRKGDLSKTHNSNQVNPPEEPQFEGVVFTDGTCAIRWCTEKKSTSFWNSFEDMMAIHGHPEYDSELIWHDKSVQVIAYLTINETVTAFFQLHKLNPPLDTGDFVAPDHKGLWKKVNPDKQQYFGRVVEVDPNDPRIIQKGRSIKLQ